MLAKLHTFSLLGIEAVPVEVEVDVSPGTVPETILVGLPEAAACESTRPAKGVLSMAMAAARQDGLRGFVVPDTNAAEAAVVEELESTSTIRIQRVPPAVLLAMDHVPGTHSALPLPVTRCGQGMMSPVNEIARGTMVVLMRTSPHLAP